MGELAAISSASSAAAFVHRLRVGRHVVDQPDLPGPGGVDVLAGEGQLGQVPGPDDGGQPLQAPEVGHDRHLGLAHREDGVGRGQPDVAGRDEVDPAADAVPVDGGDDRLGALGDGRDGGLEAQDVAAGLAGPSGHATAPASRRPHRPHRRPAVPAQHAPHRLEVQADREVRPPGRHHDHPHVGVLAHGLHGPGQVAPQVLPHGVAGLGPVQPDRGHGVVLLDTQDR